MARFPKKLLLCMMMIAVIKCGEKFDLSQLPVSELPKVVGDTVYIQQNPAWTAQGVGGFSGPKDILIGFEPLVYVCDTGNDRIVMMDLAGYVLGVSKQIKHPIAISQDRKLNLVVCADFDTVVQGQRVTYGAIYKIRQFAAGNRIDQAIVDRLYFESGKPLRRFTGVAALYNNQFYVTRVGPDNSSPIDPDNAVLLFDKNDTYLTPIPNLKPNGTGLESIQDLTSITTFNSRNLDFVFAQKGEQSLFRVQWITFIQTQDYSYYQTKFSPTRDGNLDILRINHFRQPEDVTVDNSGNIYVVDAATDSLYKFDSKGRERQSFGGRGVFNMPHGVAFFDKTLYVADTGNNRVLRFILSTDLR
jgi:DNA-binding beta-propeller fold protein YncE